MKHIKQLETLPSDADARADRPGHEVYHSPLGARLREFRDRSRHWLRGGYLAFRAARQAVGEALEDNRFADMTRRCKLVSDEVFEHRLGAQAPYPVLVTGGGGLNFVRGARMTTMLRPHLTYGYLFGIVVYEDTLLLSYNYHLGGGMRRNPSANRASAILSVRLDDLQRSIARRVPVRYETLVFRTRANFSYLNLRGDTLLASNYLGTAHAWTIERGPQGLRLEDEKVYSINRDLFGIDLYYYPYTHLNCISADERYYYLGAHMHTKNTGIGGRLYRLDPANGSVELARQTKFVSAHDIMMCGGTFYGSDSGRGAFYAGDKLMHRGKGFARGLSVNSDGWVIGMSANAADRRQRQRVSPDNGLVFLDRDGAARWLHLPTHSIYRVYASDRTELTQSDPHALSLS